MTTYILPIASSHAHRGRGEREEIGRGERRGERETETLILF
jgi:hypothetical protein